MSNIFLVRHGQTIWNKEMRFQGHSDIELSELGLQQAYLLKDRLKTEKFDAVYSSSLQRAVDTAKIIVQDQNLAVVQNDDLKEMCFGVWEGLTREQIEKRWPGQVEAFFNAPLETAIPEGENYWQLQERTWQSFENIAQKHKNENVLIVCHGGTIRVILATILKMDLAAIWSMRQDNTAVNIINCHDDNKVVALVNDIRHLIK